MPIHRCQKCNYLLVLLEKRGKFKCAKCGKLFPQKEVEDESFRRWNQKMKEKNENDLKLASRKPKLTEEEKKLRDMEYRKKYYEQNKEKIKESSLKWRDKNREKYLADRRDFWANNKDRLNAKRRREWIQNHDKNLQEDRIRKLRKKQVKLALNKIKADLNKYVSYGI